MSLMGQLTLAAIGIDDICRKCACVEQQVHAEASNGS
jgi:hypothetical protein